MELSARPLYATPDDSKLFVAPSQWDPCLGYLRHRLSVLVQGRPGSGKTTLLHQLTRSFDDAIYVEAIDAPDVLALVEHIHDALLPKPEAEYTGRLFTHEPSSEGDRRRPSTRSSSELLREIATLGRRTVLLDSTNSSAAVNGLFSRHHGELWRSEVRWVVAIDSDQAAIELQSSALDFFEARLSLDAWTEEQLVDLLSRRCTHNMTPEQIDGIVHAASASPRAAIALARRFVVESPEAVNAQIRRRNAAEAIGPSAIKALAELEALGELSASDARLHHRLGWSRERATQVFGELERRDIVTSRSVRQERGRPRKLYALNEMF